MIGKAVLFKLFLGAALLAFLAVPAVAGAFTDPSQDPRHDMAVRSGTMAESLYGPYTLSAAQGGVPGEIKNQISQVTPPCSNCRITDMVPDLVKTSDTNTTVNIQDGLMLHHFLLKDQGKPDIVCPTGLQGQGGIRFMAAGNERTHLHFPGNYGYTPSGSNWLLISHLLNFNTSQQQVYVKITWRYRPLDQTRDLTPVWLDVDGCNDAEYTAPVGYSDTHIAPPGPNTNSDWTVPSGWKGHIVAISGHSHDITVDLNPSCTIQCMDKGGGIAVAAEVMGGSGSTYYGPNPIGNAFLPYGPPTFPSRPSTGPVDGSGNPVEPTDLTGADLCRSEAKYGTSTGTTLKYNGHLDTMSLCGVFTDVPGGAQPEAYPAGGAYPIEGFPIQAGQVIRLHSEYWNNTGANKTNVMGIMVAYVDREPSYERPQSAGPVSTSLVPVARQCGTGANPTNGAHSPPLNAGGACLPGGTTGVAHMGAASVSTAALTPVGTPGGSDDSDVNLTASLTDIRSTSPTGPDYDPNGANPELTLVSKWRVSDLANGTTGTGAGTATDLDFAAPINCTATGGAGGSNCSLSTSADAVSPGSIPEGKAMVASLFRVRVNDSGADNIRGNGDDKLFAQQGFYVP